MRHNAPPTCVAIALLCGACGYSSVQLPFDEIQVSATTAQSPYPELSACVTVRLRQELAQRGVHVHGAAPWELETTVLSADAHPDALTAQGQDIIPRAQRLEAALRARIVTEEGRVLFGPTIYRGQGPAAHSPNMEEALASQDVAMTRLCARLVENLLFDLPDLREE